MQLEDYFEIIAEDAIRIAGTRVGIETVIDDYQKGAIPEEIVLHYPTLSLEQIYATITYYLANQEKVKAYTAIKGLCDELATHAKNKEIFYSYTREKITALLWSCIAAAMISEADALNSFTMITRAPSHSAPILLSRITWGLLPFSLI